MDGSYQLWLRPARASLPKSKNGCVNCKQRHVRCPGEKPTCSKCQKANRLCEYATERLPQKSAVRPSIRFQMYSPKPSNALSHPRFVNEAEHRGFDHFSRGIAHSLSFGMGWLGWGDFVLQISSQDTAIRHAAIALGAIHMYRLKTVELCREENNRGLLELSYRQYGEAVCRLQDRLRLQNGVSPLDGLLACTLLAIFEFVQGDDVAAALHLRAGLMILRTFVSDTGLLDRAIVFRGQNSLSDEPLIGSKAKKFDHVTAENSWDLQRSFAKTFSFLDFWSLRWSDGEVLFPEISLIDGLILEPTVHDEEEINFQLRCFGPLETRIYEFLRAVKARRNNSHKTPVTASVSDVRNELLTRLLNRYQELSRLHAAEYGILNARQSMRVQVVSLNYRKLRVMLLACKDDDTYDYRPFDSTFQDMVATSRSITKHGIPVEAHLQLFSFEPSLVHPLYRTAICCCDVSICQEAIELLQSMRWTGGAWNGQIMAKIARRKLVERFNQNLRPDQM